MVGTAEYIYNRDVNGVYYINANLPAAQTTFAGADAGRATRATASTSTVTNNIVLKNQDVGRSWNLGRLAQQELLAAAS